MSTLKLEHIAHIDNAGPDISIDSSGHLNIVNGNLQMGGVTMLDASNGDLSTGNNASVNIRDAAGEVAGRIRNWSSPTNSIAIESDPSNSAANSYLTFTVDGDQKMTILGNNVGIGTTNPSKQLQVRESSTATTSVHYPISVGGSNHVAAYATGIGLDPEGYGYRNKIAIVAEGINQGWSRGKLHFLLRNDSNDDEATLAHSKVTILENGNVGIGTSNPGAGLELNLASGDGLLINSADIATIKMKATGGAVANWGFATTNLAAGDFGIYRSNAVGGDPITAGTAKMYFTSDGNVSINSTAPDLVGNTTTLTIGNSSGGGDGMLSLQSGWGNTTYGRMFTSSGVFKIGNPQSNKLVLYTANLDRLRIDENGRAGWSPDGGSNFYIIHGKDGSSSSNAALSAEEIKRTLGSRAVSGYYWLITPSDGVARQWWCDMETDGGGWILVGHHGDGQLATNPGNWFDSTNAGSFNAHSTGTFKGGGYWRTWGAEHVMIECRTDDTFFNNSAVSKVGFKWGSSNNLPSSAAAYNLPTKTFKDWCWDIYNAPGYDPANYQNAIRDSSVNGNASFTEHFVFSWSPRTTGSPGDDGSNGPYWQIGSHHDGIHQHYEESAGGNGVYGNGGFHVVSNEDAGWGGGGNRFGMQRLFRYNDNSGTVNIWIR